MSEFSPTVLSWSAVNCGFEFRLGQTKDYKIGICCFSGKQPALRKKSKNGASKSG